MESADGRAAYGWLLGDGVGRGIALVFLIGGVIMVVAAGAAMLTRSYRTISAQYLEVEPGEPDARPDPAFDRREPAPGESAVEQQR